MMRGKTTHRGTSFEDFLKREGLLENVQAAASYKATADFFDRKLAATPQP